MATAGANATKAKRPVHCSSKSSAHSATTNTATEANRARAGRRTSPADEPILFLGAGVAGWRGEVQYSKSLAGQGRLGKLRSRGESWNRDESWSLESL